MSTLSRPHGLQPTRLLCSWNFPVKNTGVVCHFLLQGSSRPKDQTQISCVASRFFTTEPSRSPVIFFCIINGEESIQFSSVTRSCLTLCDPMNRSTPGLPVHHQLLEFTQICVHRVGDAIQPSHPLLSPSPPAPNPSPHQSLFQ